ncbi:MAG: HAD family hydrolase [Pseudomonadota bacterium]
MEPIRIAMWSGPRNLSTALMRSFAERDDCAVWDEPFYAAYLAETGLDHPMRAAILEAHESDPSAVAAACCADPPGAAPVLYQKHMTHHMVNGFPTGWTAHVRQAFLIRDPAQVAASYEVKREFPTLGDLGFESQKRLFDEEADRTGRAPPVVDSARLAAEPERVLSALCERLGISFTKAMLSWSAGRHPSYGIWAAHWYGAVERSTGFRPQPDSRTPVSDHARRLADEARPYYEHLARHVL